MNEITNPDALQASIDDSNDHPVLLFKHSTACPISGRANARVGDYLESKGDEAPDLRLVKVIESRPVSNAIAENLGVEHQSPQIILLKGGKSVWDASHHNIRAENIDAALAEHG